MRRFFGFSESKNETKNDIIDEEKEVNFLDSLIYENDYKKLFETTAQKFVNNIEIWVGQRSLNDEHIRNLAREFSVNGNVMGTIKLVRSTDGSIRLLDGQHRVEALKQILNYEPNFDCNLLLELYETDRLESPKTHRLFENANNVLNVQPEDRSNKNALSIIDRLSKQFEGMLKDGKCNRPFVNKKILIEKLKKAFKQIDIEQDFMFEKILEANNELKEMEIDLAESNKQKCKKTGCYLGIVKDCLWFDELFILS